MKIVNKYKMKQVDDLTNLITSTGAGSDRLPQTFFGNTLLGGNYAEMSSVYESWLGRRIVELPPTEALKKGFKIYCPSWKPDKITRLESYCEYLEVNKLLLEALFSERIFGGAIILGITDATWGAMSNPIPDYLPGNTLLRLRMFDAWQCYAAEMNFMNPLKKNFLYPETYTIGAAGMTALIERNVGYNASTSFLTGAIVHFSRVERFDGAYLPWYERQRNLYWGQSILNIIYEAIRNAGIVTSAIASLIFRASVPVMSVEDLVNIVSDEESKQSFLTRMNLLNYQMSNNNMAIIDKNETLTNLEPGSFSNLDSILERFYTLCSSATGIPVTKLVGDQAKGLGNGQEGDLNNWYDTLEAYRETHIKPHLMSMMKRWIVPSFFNQLIPHDFEIQFPPLERESPRDKQAKDSLYIDSLVKAVDAKLIPINVARQELVEKDMFSNFTQKEAEKMANEQQENIVSMDEALDQAEKMYPIEDDGVFKIDPDEDSPNDENFDVHRNKEMLEKQNKASNINQQEEPIPTGKKVSRIRRKLYRATEMQNNANGAKPSLEVFGRQWNNTMNEEVYQVVRRNGSTSIWETVKITKDKKLADEMSLKLNKNKNEQDIKQRIVYEVRKI